MLLTGGPGTGKTTIIRAVIRIFDKIGIKVALAAPTGRAAKRMSETTQREAKTIHRLLEMEFAADDKPRFRRDEDNLLEESVIIIDEASMVDTLLMASLLKAVKPGSRFILIGDADQLPSVGAGNVLCDLLASDIFHSVRLTEIYRQARESRIVTNAHAINDGDLPILDDKKGDFFFISREDETQIAPTISDLCMNRLPKKYGKDIISEIQIITPSRKGVAGTEILNERLRNVQNPRAQDKKEKKVRDITFREGDKVMQIRNNYSIEWTRAGEEGEGMFNGDIGIIETIDNVNERMYINFDGKLTEYSYDELDDIEHAYAITIHKSQGSEYPVVIIPAYMYSPRLLTRNLLYTAVTRAQKMVIIVGRAEIVRMMVENKRLAKRYTGLRYMLEAYDV
ncbi:MAG: AAA family ATPase [Clostridia bacterium]|nr:AAA family ATPase [Clostridia bacterium]